MSVPIRDHPVVSHDEWLAARTAFLVKEKEFTRARDELSRERRALPWERVEDPYVFHGKDGPLTLGDAFDGRSQLIVYHFMFAPEWDEGCPHCSFWADTFDGIDIHLAHRDVTFLAVSRAPYEKVAAFQRRMGWSFTWLSSFGTDFNYDLNVSFRPEELRLGAAVYNYAASDPGGEDREGVSAFYRNADGDIFHTYSCYARGIDIVNGAYNFLDMTPKGRDEDDLDDAQDWVRHHDRYG